MIKSGEDYCVYFPTIFSPNGDTVNDTFFPQGNQPIEIESFSIFDRWGNQLFSRKYPKLGDPSEGWDGTFRGKVCNQGVYVWYVMIKLQNGQQKIIKGELNLFR